MELRVGDAALQLAGHRLFRPEIDRSRRRAAGVVQRAAVVIPRDVQEAGAVRHEADRVVRVGGVPLVGGPPRLPRAALDRTPGQHHEPIGVVERRKLRPAVREDRLPRVGDDVDRTPRPGRTGDRDLAGAAGRLLRGDVRAAEREQARHGQSESPHMHDAHCLRAGTVVKRAGPAGPAHRPTRSMMRWCSSMLYWDARMARTTLTLDSGLARALRQRARRQPPPARGRRQRHDSQVHHWRIAHEMRSARPAGPRHPRRVCRRRPGPGGTRPAHRRPPLADQAPWRACHLARRAMGGRVRHVVERQGGEALHRPLAGADRRQRVAPVDHARGRRERARLEPGRTVDRVRGPTRRRCERADLPAAARGRRTASPDVDARRARRR